MTINYRDTLNLPQTELSMKAGLPKKEPEILDFWNDIGLYEKIRQQNLNNKKFITNTNEKSVLANIIAFPVPASNQLNVIVPEYVKATSYVIRSFDGRILLNSTNSKIDINN